MNTLDARLLAAHDARDQPALVRLYTEAADQSETADAAGFFLTQAYIYALELGDRAAAGLRRRLVEMGRETPPDHSSDS